MNTFWLKVAGLIVLVLAVIVAVNKFSSYKKEPKIKPKTFYDVVEEDDERLRAEPQFEQSNQTPPAPQQEPVAEVPEPKQIAEPAKPQFKELSTEELVQAEKLFNLAVQERKMGRLPGVKLGYKNMVDHCREIIQRWPDSEYAFKAKRMLRDIPERYRKRYKITDEEIDLGNLK